MPDRGKLVINTGPILALIAGLGDLQVLKMYSTVVVPREVHDELNFSSSSKFGVEEYNLAEWLDISPSYCRIAPYLKNSLDKGEASVIQTALDHNIQRVCIDEALGRRAAKLCGLSLTGSIGILLKAHKEGFLSLSVDNAIKRMRAHGIWLSNNIVDFALRYSEKNNW